ncbi:MAG: diguanylate cyclase [Chloroflexi bacterium]|nr:diguanylate cyclase [Chloroflexota bacterium]
MKDFSRPTQIYILGMIALAGFLVIWQFTRTTLEVSWLLLVACVLASFLQGVAVFGATARSTYSLSWVVFGFTIIVLGPTATFVVVFVSHVAEWLLDRDRLKWYIQTFNISNFFICFTIADLIISWGKANFTDNLTLLFAINFGSLIVFTLVNHLLIAWVVKLARGQSITESGVFGRFTLLLDLTLLCLGFATAVIWQTNPAATILIGFVAYILFQALNIPALERKTEIDAKTELFNARYFTQALDEEMVRSKRFKRPLSLIMADLDFLRKINNTYGHLAGDVVLQGIAKILQDATRDFDVVSRFGGEEFAIMLPETALEDAYIVAERIRQRIEEFEFSVSTSVHPIRATMSFGISGLEGKKQSIDNLIHNADIALYQAKGNGRNRVMVFDNQSDGVLDSTRDWTKLGLAAQSHSKSTVNHSNSQQANKEGISEPNLEESMESFPEKDQAPATAAGASPEAPLTPNRRQFPDWVTTAYISALSIAATGIAIILIGRMNQAVDLSGLLYFSLIVLLMEAFSIEIYVRDTVVSTSAALLVAGVLLFGPAGAVVLGIIIAFVSYAKQRPSISRFLFNASNHILGGLLISSLLIWHTTPIENWSLTQLLILGAGAASIIYLSTTLLLTFVIRLNTGQSIKSTWNERFRWLAPYYLALGIIAAALVYSYNTTNFTGLFIIVLPLFLLRYSQKQYIDQTEMLVQNLKKSNRQLLQKTEEVNLLNEELLLTLARSLDLRDPYVVEHSKNVSRYAKCIAEELGLPRDQIETIRKAGLLHDIGKLGVREEILFKPDRLTADEFKAVKEHVAIGASLVQGCHSLEPLAPFILHHHEWFNGQGYPHGLSGKEIPLEARILSVADAVEAMASDRPYKEAMSPATIMAEVQHCVGSQFDPMVADAFSQVIKRLGETVIVNSARIVLARQTNDTRTYEPHY